MSRKRGEKQAKQLNGRRQPSISKTCTKHGKGQGHEMSFAGRHSCRRAVQYKAEQSRAKYNRAVQTVSRQTEWAGQNRAGQNRAGQEAKTAS